jgi:thiamine kinase-like enzyme
MVDWEWAGVGLPHADIAALVKSVRQEDHLALLQAFVEEDRRVDAERHWRLFHWGQLERRLLDAAFLAKLEMESSERLSWRADISHSAREVLLAIERLDAGSTRAAT